MSEDTEVPDSAIWPESVMYGQNWLVCLKIYKRLLLKTERKFKRERISRSEFRHEERMHERRTRNRRPKKENKMRHTQFVCGQLQNKADLRKTNYNIDSFVQAIRSPALS